MTFDRKLIAARRSVSDALTVPFRSLEMVSDDAAIQGFKFLALALEQRRDAGVSVDTGAAAIDLMFRASEHAYRAQSLVREVHALWPSIADENNLYAPECPPKGSVNATPLAAVA